MAKHKRTKAPTDAPVEPAPVGHTAITIQGHIFHVSAPYSEGHTLTANEAIALNRVRAENIRNNTASLVAKYNSDENGGYDHEAAQSAVAAYDAEYNFSGARLGRTPVDPVEREATRIAKEKITQALASKGIAVKSLVAGRFDSLVENLLAKRPEIRVEAKRRLAEAAEAAGDVLGELEFSAPEQAQAAE